MIKKKTALPDDSVLHQVLESLDNFLTEGIFRKAADSSRLIYVSEAMAKVFGYSSAGELLTIPSNRLFADEETYTYLMDKISAEGSIVDQRVLFKRKDHSNFWGLLTCRRISRDGQVFHDGRMNDISDQMITEDQLKDTCIELEKITMELDGFIYRASHDIRSPISSILGIVNLMKLDIKGDLAEKYIEMIGTSAAKLDKFVHELTLFAKNGRKAMDEECINFEFLLQDILQEFNQTHLNFSTVVPTYSIHGTAVFYSDPDRIRLVLQNIIRNSLDYVDKKKTTHMLSIEVHLHPGKAFIEVFDNGIGIAAPHVPKVFDMFYRASNISTGSGIGLYTVRDAVTRLGGVITIDSKYGVGTSVKIEMPNSKKGKLINKKKALRSI